MNLNNHLKETPSVRMHAPPGGKSNNIFGGDHPQFEPKQQQHKQIQRPVEKLAENPTTLKQGQMNSQNQAQSQIFQSQDQQNPNQQVKTSVKVNNPPGGRSQISFG